nr:BtrH N-terminal domain-containing protein [Clostridium yunnanense]
MAIAFKSFNKRYFDIYLLISSFVQVYIAKDENKTPYSFIDIYNEFIKDIFDIEIVKQKFDNKEAMHNCIKKAIDNDMPVLIPGDLYNLFYFPNYKKEHFSHLFIIKGYDSDTNIYYILDSAHIDSGASTILGDFAIKKVDMYDLSKLYCAYFENEESIQYLYTFRKCSKKNVSVYDTLKLLERILRMLQDGKLNSIYWEEELVKQLGSGSGDSQMMYGFTNFKSVYQFYINELLKEVKVDQISVEKFTELSGEVNKEWIEIRNKTAYYAARKANDFKDIYQRIEKNISLENECRTLLISILADIKSVKQEESSISKGFVILNNNDAVIENTEKGIRIKHYIFKTYDTWLAQDNAAQILIKDIGKRFSIETRISTNTNLGEWFHAGIIVKLKDGTKYLFGNHKKEEVSIFCPSLGDKFQVYSKASYNQETKSYFKVCKKDNEIFFYIHDYEENETKLIYSMYLNEEIDSVGLFSKTWMKINHEILFYDIKVIYE